MINQPETNKEKLSECLKDIDKRFNGLKTPLSIYTGGENGLASEEKIDEFAEKLVSSQCNLFGYYVGISGIQRRHIHLLCYLILRAFDPDDDTLDFSDFLRDAKNLDKCKSREKNIVAAYENHVYVPDHAYCSDIMRRIRYSCRLLTGRSVSDDFSEAEIGVMKETIDARRRDIAKLKKKCEDKTASSERITKSAADELRARYAQYGIEGDTDFWDAMDNEYHYLYGNTFWEDEENRSLFSFSRRLGRRRTAAEEESWQVQRKELEDKWKQSFADPLEYLRAFREFIEINALVHEFSIKHPLDESVMELLAKDKYDITFCGDDFLKYFSELNRIPRILKRRV